MPATLEVGQKMRVLLAGDRPQDRDQGRKAALRIGLECTATDCVSLSDLRVRLVRQPVVDLVVVFVDSDCSAATKAIGLATDQTRQPIYAVVSGDAITNRDELLAAGATEVWPINDLRDGLLSSSNELRQSGKSPDTHGRIIAMTAAQMGVGATTIASGLAFALSGRKSVLLAELGTEIPELALDLDLAPKHSLAELIHASDRMDASMVRETVVKHAAGIDILAYMPETLRSEPFDAAVTRDFQILLRNLYEWVVLDVGPRHGIENEEILRAADLVCVVTRLDPASLRMTHKYIRTITENGVRVDDVMLIANRYGQSGQIPWQKAEEALRTKVAAWLPDDTRSVNRALTSGQPLVQAARWAKLTRELSRLAGEIQKRLMTVR
jgi:pilus assembly protein CpaE